jgi:hypothetical protein
MRTIAHIVAGLLVLTVALGAQASKTSPTPTPKAKPDFSGHWTAVSPPAKAGVVCIVTQDGKTLTTEQTIKNSTRKMTYQLDGVERSLVPPGRTADITVVASASWDGDHIVFTRRESYSIGMKIEAKEVWSIDAKGQLVIDSSETGNGQPGPSEKITYVKK